MRLGEYHTHTYIYTIYSYSYNVANLFFFRKEDDVVSVAVANNDKLNSCVYIYYVPYSQPLTPFLFLLPPQKKDVYKCVRMDICQYAVCLEHEKTLSSKVVCLAQQISTWKNFEPIIRIRRTYDKNVNVTTA